MKSTRSQRQLGDRATGLDFRSHTACSIEAYWCGNAVCLLANSRVTCMHYRLADRGTARWPL